MGKWIERISPSDRKYIVGIAKELAANPDASIHIVARQISEFFDDAPSQTTIVNALKELIRYEQEKAKA